MRTALPACGLWRAATVGGAIFITLAYTTFNGALEGSCVTKALRRAYLA